MFVIVVVVTLSPCHHLCFDWCIIIFHVDMVVVVIVVLSLFLCGRHIF